MKYVGMFVLMFVLFGCSGNPYKCKPTFSFNVVPEQSKREEAYMYNRFVGIKCCTEPVEVEKKWPDSGEKPLQPAFHFQNF